MNTLRKITSLLLTLAMVISLLGAGLLSPAAHAAQDIYVTGHHVNPLYEDVLSATIVSPPLLSDAVPAEDPVYLGSLEELGEAVREVMEDRNTNPVLYFSSQRVIDTGEKLKAFMVDEVLPIAFTHTGIPTEGDYLRWHYQNMSFGLKGSHDGTTYLYTLTLTINYYTTAEQEQTVNREVTKLLDSLELDTATDYQRLCGIYDYICANVTYDNANLNNDSYTLKYTCYAALMNGTAVCQGYALLLYRLALELGVDARLIAGDGGGPHGWNIARINDLYYNLDSTWDAGETDYSYFLVCPTNFKNHIRYDDYDNAQFHAAYPMDGEDYDPASETCAHSYTSRIMKEASCTEDGEQVLTCSKCGNKYSRTIYSEGHRETADRGYAATCTEDGLTDGSHCSRCSIVLTEQEVIPALGHDEVTDDGFAATCTEDGLTDGSHCSQCSIVLTEQKAIPALGHSWDEGIVTQEPTETETGIRTFTCETCGETRTETIPALDHTHSYTAVVTAPTCTDEGFTTYTCSCGDSYTGDEVAALGHNEVIDEGFAATCTEDGLTDGSHCSRCNLVLTEQKAIPALGHSWGEGIVTQEPTETETGIRTFTCETCGETRTETIPCIEQTSNVIRISGKGRCETAIEAADTLKEILNIDRFDSIILASGSNFADALTGSYLANAKGAPILLHFGSSTGKNLEYIRNNLAKDGIVYILGGAAAVPEEVEDALTDAGLTVERVKGKSRFDTNLAILNTVGIGDQEILISTGWSFADSLSVSATGLPILMVDTKKNELTEAQIAFLTSHAANKVTIVGGTGAVSAELEHAIAEIVEGDISRISGKTREATSVAVAETYFHAPAFAVAAYSQNFPDGLCGGPLAYAMGAPLLLINKGAESAAAAYVDKHGIQSGYVLGGTGVVTDATVHAVFG